MKPPITLDHTSLKNHPSIEKVEHILNAALEAVDPYQVMNKYVRREGNRMWVDGQWIDLDEIRRIWVVGVGKASLAMTQAMTDILGDRLTEAVVIPKFLPDGYSMDDRRIHVLAGNHPIPGAESVTATKAVFSMFNDLQKEDLVFFLVSGGGSALFTWPVEGVTIREMQALTNELLRCGATIQEMNTIRKHLDRVKGGGFLKLTNPARMISLILSDVVGSDLSVIASGPTVPDLSTYADAMNILRKYRIVEKVPEKVVDILQRGMNGDLPETLKPGDVETKRVRNILVGSNEHAANEALRQADMEGFHSLVLTTSLEGEASEVGKGLAFLAQKCASTGEPVSRPACLIAGGETTVTVRGKGRGGRNQELALGAVRGFSGLEDAALITLATDGEDGATEAAGAVVTGRTAQKAREMKVDPAAYLENNDSYTFFDRLSDLIKPGPSGTNVNDLTFIYLFKEGER